MADIEKGVVLTVEGPLDNNGNNTKARVQPISKSGLVSRPLTIPWWLRGAMINKGTEIAYVLFEDQTGVIISRMDGEWSGTLSGSINITGGLTTAGNVTAADMITPSVESLNSFEAEYSTHVHGGVDPGSSQTSGPQ